MAFEWALSLKAHIQELCVVAGVCQTSHHGTLEHKALAVSWSLPWLDTKPTVAQLVKDELRLITI